MCFKFLQPPAHAGSSLADFSILKMEAIRSSETSVHTRSTRRHILEDGILQSMYFLEFIYHNTVLHFIPVCGTCEKRCKIKKVSSDIGGFI
jgi:hypothetical protein